jgi:hypothetical protein
MVPYPGKWCSKTHLFITVTCRVLINRVIRTRTRHFHRAYPPTRDVFCGEFGSVIGNIGHAQNRGISE